MPSQIDGKPYHLALDLGASISFLSQSVFEPLAAEHPGWPRATGAIGPANLWGIPDEPKWKLLRIDRIQYGPLELTGVAVVDFPTDRMKYFENRAGIATAGLLGSDALLDQRIGLDYAHATVYFERTGARPAALEAVGLVLRPEDDGRFTILGAAELDGNPAVAGAQAGDHLVAIGGAPVAGRSMGQVWAMLTGRPGATLQLTIERGGAERAVTADVQRWLDVPPPARR